MASCIHTDFPSSVERVNVHISGPKSHLDYILMTDTGAVSVLVTFPPQEKKKNNLIKEGEFISLHGS